VRKNLDHAPLAYNLRDELSTTISANPFDYDFNPLALAEFRRWLETQYADLPSLNGEWETQFASWDDVKPFTTDQIKNRTASGEALPRGKPDWQAVQRLEFDPLNARRQPTRWNFSPWADFRTYMDLSLARVLDDLRQAAHELDPRTPVGIEGTQMPHAFGGYDLWRLSQALDWVEPYDIGNAREILGSFMPGKTFLTTVFENDTNHALRRLWHLLLEGDRGCIVWWSEDCLDWKSAHYRLTPKAAALAPALREMTSSLARLFLRAEPEHDPIYLHYSQPSIQVDWLLESTVDGSTWLRRFSSFEADHNRLAKARNGWLKVFQDLGLSPRFLSAEQLERGALKELRNAALVLVNSRALSEKEVAELRAFLERDTRNQVLGEGSPGIFDAHGKLRSKGPFDDLLPPASGTGETFVLGAKQPLVRNSGAGEHYPAERLKGILDWPALLGAQLKTLRPPVSVPPSAHVRIHRYRLGENRLLAFERNVDYQMSEDLKQAGGNESFEKPLEVEATLSEAAHLYDLRSQKYLGQTNRLHFTLDPWKPSLFALTTRKVPEGETISFLDRSE
jgi:hypothetical protein